MLRGVLVGLRCVILGACAVRACHVAVFDVLLRVADALRCASCCFVVLCRLFWPLLLLFAILFVIMFVEVEI